MDGKYTKKIRAITNEKPLPNVDWLIELNNYKFRPFHEGFKELIKKSGYSDKSSESMWKYVNNKLKTLYTSSTDVDILKIYPETVKNWILGESAPDISLDSRERIYQVCFALAPCPSKVASIVWLEYVKHFFHHVYWNRAFNCHYLNETVYYYCLQRGLPYNKARDIINEIKEFSKTNSVKINHPKNKLDTDSYEMLTQNLVNDINIRSTNENPEIFVNYLKENIHCFVYVSDKTSNTEPQFITWNSQASCYINKLFEEIRGDIPNNASDTFVAKHIRKSDYFSWNGIKEHGLLIRELKDTYALNDPQDLETLREMLRNLSGKLSKEFILDYILGTTEVQKQKSRNYKRKLNRAEEFATRLKESFPSKVHMVNALAPDNINATAHYEKIRRLLVLLHFYIFWCSRKLKKGVNEDSDNTLIKKEDKDNRSMYVKYIDEINNILSECSYEELFPGNIFDFMIMKISQIGYPVDNLRTVMAYYDNKMFS